MLRRRNRITWWRQQRRRTQRSPKGERAAVGRVGGGPSPFLVLIALLMLVEVFAASVGLVHIFAKRIEVRALPAASAAERPFTVLPASDAMAKALRIRDEGLRIRDELLRIRDGRASEARALQEGELEQPLQENDPLLQQSERNLQRVEESIRQVDALIRQREQRQREAAVPDWPAPAREGTLFVSLGVVLTGLFFAFFFLQLSTGNTDLGQVGWDMEWLFTFPVPARGLFLAKLGEFVLADVMGWLVFPPFLIVFLWRAGYGIWGVPLGLFAAVLPITLLAAMRLLAVTWMRKRFSRGTLKNLQAIAGLFGMLLFFAVFWVGMHPPEGLFGIAARTPVAVLALPWTAALLPAVSPLAFLLVPVLAFGAAAGALSVASGLVRDGLLVSGGSAYGGTRGARSRGASHTGPRRLRGIAGKEIRLLLRDRNLFVQMLVVPLLLVALQVAVNPSLRGAAMSPRNAVVFAYGVGAYVLMFGAFAVLHVERDALWLLYTFPRRLSALLWQKVVLWASVALVYMVGGLALMWRPTTSLGNTETYIPLFGMLGIPVIASIAAGFGALGTDPHEQNPQRRVSPRWVYLYLLLAGVYGSSLAMAGLWPTFVLLVLLGALAWAIWQKADDRLRVLLDPVAEPLKELSAANGMIAVFCFFVLQGILMLPFLALLPPVVAVVLAYALAGVIVAGVVRLRLKPAEFRRRAFSTMGLGQPVTRGALGLGVLAGVAAAGVGAAWLVVVDAVPALRDVKEGMTVLGGDAGELWWVVFALAVVAAPLVEEFLFRGMLLGGMRRSLPARLAVPASAVLFAVVHPPISFPAVFALGLAAGIVFVKTRRLWACVATHAVYNAIVLLLTR